MQFKLLQTYRTISSFAMGLIMEFIPFMIYAYAQPQLGTITAFFMMFGFWALQCMFSFIFTTLLKKDFFSKPQIFLLIRALPIVACEIAVLFLSLNSWWIIIITAMFSGLECAVNYVPIEIIYNYVSQGQNEKTLGFTKFLDQLGWLIAGIIGGAFLDYLPQWFVVVFSLGLFVGSAIPLVIFYFKFRKEPTFNKDFVSTLVAANSDNQKIKTAQNKFLKKHFIASVLLGPTVFGFYYISSAILYIKTGSFLISGMVTSIYDGIYGLCCLLAGKILVKYDGKNLMTFAIFHMTISLLAILFVPIVWLKSLIFLVVAITQPLLTIHFFQSYLDKGRILGVGNKVLLNQYRGNVFGDSFLYAAGIFGLLPITLLAVGAMAWAIVYCRKAENETTKDLVDLLSFNDIPSQ